MTARELTAVAYRTVALVVAVVVLGLLFRELASLILAVLITVIVAIPVSACATFLERAHIPRGLGAAIGLTLGLVVIAGVLALVVPPLAQETKAFVNDLPNLTIQLERSLGRLIGAPKGTIGNDLKSSVQRLGHNPGQLLGPLASIGLGVLSALGALVVVLITALYIAVRPQPLIDGAVRLFPPPRRDAARTVMGELGHSYVGWLRGLFAGMVILGAITFVGLKLVGLSFAVFFAAFTAVAIVVPYFGALASAVPPVLYALTVSPTKALIVAAIYLVAHQVEGNVIEPLVMARAVRLHPALIAVGVVAVERIFGFVGLLVAVPLLATASTVVRSAWVEPMERAYARASRSRA